MILSQTIEGPKTVMEKVGPNIISHVSNTYNHPKYPEIIKLEPIMGIDFSITKHVLIFHNRLPQSNIAV